MSKKAPLPPQKVQDVILGHVIANAAAAPVGAFIPCLDQAVVTGSWATMFCQIAGYYDHDFNPEAVTKIVTTAGAGLGAYMIGSKIASYACTFVFTGPAGPAVVNAALNAYYTRSLGYGMNAVLKEDDINAATLKQLGRNILSYVAPIPSLSDLKEVWNIVKDHL